MASEETAKKSTTKKRTTKKTASKAGPGAKAARQGGKAVGGTTLRVKQVRSAIGSPGKFRRTLTALGIKHHQDEVVVPDNPSIRGMLNQVGHLLDVKREDS